MNIYTIIKQLQAPHKPGQKSKFMQGFPFFYGWVIFAAATFGQIMLTPGLTFAVSQFIDPLIRDLNITRTLVSTLYTAATILGSLSLPIVGRLVDRHGPRLMGTLISLLFGLGIIYMGFVNGPVTLFIGFFALRMLGQCSLGLVCTNVINLWWVRRRGSILGLSGVIFGVGGFGVFPNMIQSLIAYRDWRFAYILMGVIVTLVLVPVVAVFFRNRPEDYGLRPDGIADVPAGENTIQVTPPLEENWTLSAAMRTPIFWIISFGTAIISLLISGLFFHLVSIFEDHQLTAAAAASTFLPVALASAIFNLLSGILVDRVDIKHLLALSQITLIGCILLALEPIRDCDGLFTWNDDRRLPGLVQHGCQRQLRKILRAGTPGRHQRCCRDHWYHRFGHWPAAPGYRP